MKYQLEVFKQQTNYRQIIHANTNKNVQEINNTIKELTKPMSFLDDLLKSNNEAPCISFATLKSMEKSKHLWTNIENNQNMHGDVMENDRNANEYNYVEPSNDDDDVVVNSELELFAALHGVERAD